MDIIALLSKRKDILHEAEDLLKKHTLYPLKTLEELEELCHSIPVDLVIIDTLSHELSSVDAILSCMDGERILLVTPEGFDEDASGNLASSVYGCIDAGSFKTELPLIVEQALERQKARVRLLRETNKNHNGDVMPEMLLSSDNQGLSSEGGYLQYEVIINLARMLSACSDINGVLNHFMNAVMGFVRVSKMSVMLREGESFYIKAHHGIDPYMAEHLKLGRDSALVAWFTRHGGVIKKPIHSTVPSTREIEKEMDVLQCILSFPMMYNGRLIGIFNINNKITDEPFQNRELEMIYLLCSSLAAVINNIDLYHQMRHHKEFIERILFGMKSGMIVIDKEGQIALFNRQAGEVLGLEPSGMIGNDWTMLPPPLGDILYETLRGGNLYRRHEVSVPPSGILLGIDSYRLLDEQQKPVGAGIVFSDISDLKSIEEQVKRAERLEVANELMAKIAHEVRNPLTAIQTYTQLIDERCSNNIELHDFYTSSVSKSIQKLNTLIDRLITSSISDRFNLERVSVADLVDEIEDYISRNVTTRYNLTQDAIEPSLLIDLDRKLFLKAVHYIITYIINRGGEAPLEIVTRTQMRGLPSFEMRVVFGGEEVSDEEKERLFGSLMEVDNLELGLDIPISYKIIKGHKGDLKLISEGGKNIFIIDIPTVERRSA